MKWKEVPDFRPLISEMFFALTNLIDFGTLRLVYTAFELFCLFLLAEKFVL